MPLVEGLGDEVTLILGLLTIIIVLLIAWLSTHTRDIPFFSVIVVELSQRAARNQQSRSSTADSQSQGSVQEAGETPSPSVEITQHRNVQQSKPTPLVNVVADAQVEAVVDNADNAIERTENSPSDQQSSPDVQYAASNVEPNSGTESTQSNTAQNVTTTQSVCDSKHKPQSRTDFASDVEIAQAETSSDSKVCNESSSVCDSETISPGTVPPTDSDFTQVRHRDVPSREAASVPAPGTIQSSTTPPNPASTAASGDFLDATNDDHIGQIRIRLKYLNDTQRLVYSSPTDTIGQFRREHFSTELAANKLVRLIFNGQDMRNDTNTLQGYNITDNSVIHCLITQNLQGSTQPRPDTGDGDVQLGSFMMPLFAVILAAVWYLRITQRQYFNAVSTLSLAGVTFLFLLGCASVWRTGGNREHQHVD